MYISRPATYIARPAIELFYKEMEKYPQDQTIRRFVFTKFVNLWEKHYFCTQ